MCIWVRVCYTTSLLNNLYVPLAGGDQLMVAKALHLFSFLSFFCTTWHCSYFSLFSVRFNIKNDIYNCVSISVIVIVSIMFWWSILFMYMRVYGSGWQWRWWWWRRCMRVWTRYVFSCTEKNLITWTCFDLGIRYHQSKVSSI